MGGSAAFVQLVTQRHPHPVFDLACELAAGGGDVVAAGTTDDRHDPRLKQYLTETVHDLRRRTLVFGTRKWIERDQIDLGRAVLEQPGQPVRLVLRVIDPGQHDVLESNSNRVGGLGIGPAGLEQLGNGMTPVDRYQLIAQLVIRSVQRDRKRRVAWGCRRPFLLLSFARRKA